MKKSNYRMRLMPVAVFGIVGLLLLGVASQLPLRFADDAAASWQAEGLPVEAESKAPDSYSVAELIGLEKERIFRVDKGDLKSRIEVSGHGQASSAPDQVILSFGVSAFDDDVASARTTAAKAMTDVLETLKKHEIDQKDIQTNHFSISPRYNSREVTRCTEKGKGDSWQESDPENCYQEWESFLIGYQVTNNISARVRNLDSISSVIDDITDSGGDFIRFNDVQFAIDDTSELERQAREAAVADLKERASQLAEFAGVELGELVYLTETGFSAPPPMFAQAAAAYSESSRQFSTPIATGELDVDISVHGVFAISPTAKASD